LTCVDLMRAYLNRQDLADALVSAVWQLQKAQARTGEPAFSMRSTQSPSQWRVGDRLSKTDTEQLIAYFAAGTSKRKLAERYGIGESSVKRLIRQHGPSKPGPLSNQPGEHESGVVDDADGCTRLHRLVAVHDAPADREVAAPHVDP
jgi:hypothetical protein